MHIYRPFFYVIQHIHTGINYAGYKANSKPFMVEGGYCTSSKIIKKIIKEEGLGVFKVRRIKYFDIQSEAHSYEVRFLKRVNAKDNLLFYNQSNDGMDWGMSGKQFTPEHKEKIRKANTGKSIAPEVRDKISKKLKEKSTYVRTPEIKALQSSIRMGMKFSYEHKRNLSKWQKGIKRGPQSESRRLAISKKLKGRQMSPEWRAKMSEAQKKRYAKQRAMASSSLPDQSDT